MTDSADTEDGSGPERMRICVVLPDSYTRGMPARPAVIELFGRILPSRGHSVTWFLPTADPGESAEGVYGARVRLIHKPIGRSFPRKIANRIHYYRALRNAVRDASRESPFDVLLVRNDMIAFFLVRGSVRPPGPRMVFQYTFLKGSYRRLSLTDPVFYHRFLEHLLSSYVLGRADLVLTISDWMTDYFVDQGYPPERLYALPMGVDQGKAELPTPRQRFDWETDGARVVMYVGTLDTSRSLEVLVRAFDEVAARDDRARLVLVGDGSGQRQLEELAAGLGLRDRVIFTGKVPYEDVPEYIDAADVCVSPIPPRPEFLLSSPTKVFEYMLMSRPVVANREIPEQRAVIEEASAGVLVDFDSGSFARGIMDVLSDEAKAGAYGRAGREWVLRNRTYEALASGLEARLREMLI